MQFSQPRDGRACPGDPRLASRRDDQERRGMHGTRPGMTSQRSPSTIPTRSLPMPRKLIDLSVPLENDIAADPPGRGPKIAYVDHQQSVPEILPFFPGLRKQDLPDGEGWAMENIKLSTHNGTHLDAPYHFASTMNRGERAITIDEVPLEWCLQPGVKLDFRHFQDGYVATAKDVEA